MPWFDFRPNARWVARTWKTEAECPAIESPLFMGSDFGRLAVYSDYMHDKYLGSDKVAMPLLCLMVLLYECEPLSISVCVEVVMNLLIILLTIY